MSEIPVLNFEQALERLNSSGHEKQKNYLAMYSTWYNGVITDPKLMMVPIDDHMVHRGDAVFEAFKSIGDKIFLLEEHLDRLDRSAAQIFLKPHFDRTKIRNAIMAVKSACGSEDLLFRLYLSRGPGGFSTNPYESVGCQLYVVATALIPPGEDLYARGAKVGISEVPMKQGWMATVKSCNYLPNVIMKKEAVDRSLDFTINCHESNGVGEGSTENMALVCGEGELVFPKFDYTLRGTTLVRLTELAQELIKNGQVKNIVERKVGLNELHSAKEMMMVGTTLDVLPVTEFDGKPVGDGLVGPVAKACLKLIQDDQKG